MNSINFTLFCALIIFFATSIGAFLVYVLSTINKKTESICLGLAGGIMFASSIWSLLLPALDDSKYIFVLIGFIIGVFIIRRLDNLVNKYSKLDSKKNTMLFLAMTIHNVPEGMTVGLMSTCAFISNSAVSVSMALALTIGIAIQNIPEGAAISLNYRQSGMSKFSSALLGVISGIVEPISALIMFLSFKFFAPLLPIVLSMAASIMIYVVINDLMPNTDNQDNNSLGSIYFIVGFVIMMSLDVLL